MGDEAQSETYGLAGYLKEEDGELWNVVLNIKYLDKARRTDNVWRFIERRTIIVWSETHRVDSPSNSVRLPAN